jgi:hypothetical protein
MDEACPTGPTFLQERDAIIAAANVFSGCDDVREGFVVEAWAMASIHRRHRIATESLRRGPGSTPTPTATPLTATPTSPPLPNADPNPEPVNNKRLCPQGQWQDLAAPP